MNKINKSTKFNPYNNNRFEYNILSHNYISFIKNINYHNKNNYRNNNNFLTNKLYCY